jgi:hypothetical protein
MSRMRREILTSGARPDGPYYSAPVHRGRSLSQYLLCHIQTVRRVHLAHTTRQEMAPCGARLPEAYREAQPIYAPFSANSSS